MPDHLRSTGTTRGLSPSLKPGVGGPPFLLREQAAPLRVRDKGIDAQPAFWIRRRRPGEQLAGRADSPKLSDHGEQTNRLLSGVRSGTLEQSSQRILEPAFESLHGSVSLRRVRGPCAGVNPKGESGDAQRPDLPVAHVDRRRLRVVSDLGPLAPARHCRRYEACRAST